VQWSNLDGKVTTTPEMCPVCNHTISVAVSTTDHDHDAHDPQEPRALRAACGAPARSLRTSRAREASRRSSRRRGPARAIRS
jgi:hypothetical protein